MATPDNALQWGDIPAHLLLAICECLKEQGFAHCISDMRLVCQAWRAGIPTDGGSRLPIPPPHCICRRHPAAPPPQASSAS